METTKTKRSPNPTTEYPAPKPHVRQGKSLERLADMELSDEGRAVEEMLDESVLRWKARHDS